MRWLADHNGQKATCNCGGILPTQTKTTHYQNIHPNRRYTFLHRYCTQVNYLHTESEYHLDCWQANCNLFSFLGEGQKMKHFSNLTRREKQKGQQYHEMIVKSKAFLVTYHHKSNPQLEPLKGIW